jgi:hypothetical protein
MCMAPSRHLDAHAAPCWRICCMAITLLGPCIFWHPPSWWQQTQPIFAHCCFPILNPVLNALPMADWQLAGCYFYSLAMAQHDGSEQSFLCCAWQQVARQMERPACENVIHLVVVTPHQAVTISRRRPELAASSKQEHVSYINTAYRAHPDPPDPRHTSSWLGRVSW